jgi:hypothetical protein
MLAGEFDDYSMSENLVSYSTYNSSTWGSYFPANATITTGISAPDGTSTAIRFTCTATGSSLLRVLFPAFTPNGTDTYTSSFHVRLISGTTGGLSSDLNDGAPNGSYLSSLVSNQWVRISFSGVPTATSKSFIDLLSDSTNNYVLDFWGVQVEKGSVATDYTPTTGTAISRILPATTNTNITGFGTYYSSGFYENVGFTTFLSANVFPPYDLVYDEFGGTLFGAGQGRYMRQNTDKSVIVYNEIDEITDFRDIVRSGLVLDIDMQQPLSYTGRGLTLYDLSGNNNNATAVTTLGVANDAPGTVISLDTSSEIQVNLTANINKYAFTFSYWGRPTAIPDSNYQAICRLIDTSNPAHGYYFNMDTREVATPSVLHYVKDYTTSNWDTRQMISNAEYLNYKWHYYTLVMFAENDWKSYLDGQLLGTNTTPSQDLSSYGNINRVYFGGSSCNFNIANFSMYSTSLTSTQILQNYNALRNRFGL